MALGARVAKLMAAKKKAVLASESRRNPIVVSTGIASLDAATGVGGVPSGRWIIHHGGQSTGKTSALLHMAAEVQSLGGLVAINDVEQKLDFAYASRIGVNIDELIVNPETVDTIEGGFAWMTEVLKFARAEDDDLPILVIWDSMQASACAESIKRDYEETGWDGEARAWSRCIKKFTPELGRSRAIVGLISQVRMDIGSPQQGAQSIGVGRAPLHAAVMAFQWKAMKALGKAEAKDGPSPAREGNISEVVVKKNQAGPPMVTVNIPIRFGQGVDHPTDILLAGKQWGLVETSGAWHEVVFKGLPFSGKKFNGLKSWREFFRSDPAAVRAMRDAIVSEAIGNVERIKNE